MPHTYVPRPPSPVSYMPMPMASGANDGFFDLNAPQDPMPSGPTPAFFDLGPPPPPSAPAAAPAFFHVGNGGGGDRKYEDWND
ncbi:putative RNA-binding protein [Verticillium dahliae VDG1]|nr:putative RNA-binding protein [Verticillium dahliae VDG1]